MISVIIPVYKVERYIKGCIQSILNQDCKEFEIILVNDGTPDNSALIAEDLLSSQNKIEYRVINTPNRGVSAARNMGLKNARGDFVIMVDADDVISPCFLEDMLQMSHDYPMNDIYSSSFSIVDDSAAQCFDVSNENNAVKEYTAEEAIMVYRSRKVKFLLPTLMLRKEFLENNLISFDERVRYSDDVQFIWRCLFYHKKPV
ncbi:MAG: glycosyltransferase family 2 protein, partial [Tannerellaceae bacterium]|nr:glycosyltransferase family 2 protein [Tannerellaceae bacterium]